VHHDTVSVPSRSRSVPLLLAVAMAFGASACGTGDEERAIEIDLTTPRTPSQLVPDTRTPDLATVDGPAEFTVLLPDRTITGRFRSVNVYGDTLADSTVADDDPARAISTLDLRYEFTSDPDEVLSRISAITDTYDMAPADRAELDGFAEQFRAAVGARDGEIVVDDFEQSTGSSIYQFGVEQTATDGVSLQVRIMDDGVAAMTLFVAFDNGVG
jgi:hypothetical protein